MTGVFARTIEDLHKPRACLGRAVTTDYLGLSIAIELAHPVS